MIRKNIISNAVARVWGLISIYLFVPLYLKFLGIEAYGLVGFYSTLLGVLAFADMGFTATLNREMARLSVRKDSTDEMRDLLRTYETAYLFISSILATLLYILAPAISMHWLRSSVLQPDEITSAIRLMGIALALQLPSGLYIGGLMGLQRQVRANAIQIAWGVLRGFGAVLVLWLLSPTIFAFAFWQLISNAIYCFSARRTLWRALSPDPVMDHPPHFKWQVFRDTWRYAAGMAGMAVVSTLLTQTDKLVVSKMLSLEMLGYYTLAGAIGALPMALASPIATAVFPRLTGLVASGDRAGLAQLYRRTYELVAIAIIPAGLTIALFAGDFIFAWTGSATTAQRAGPVASLLLGGQIIQAIAIVPYYLALAHGDVRLNLQIGIVSLVLITPLLIYLILAHGLVGAGVSWFVMNIITIPIYMYYFHLRFLPGELIKWYIHGFLRPVIYSLPCIIFGRLIIEQNMSRLLAFLFIGIVWAGSVFTAGASVKEIRSIFLNQSRRILRFPNESC